MQRSALAGLALVALAAGCQPSGGGTAADGPAQAVDRVEVLRAAFDPAVVEVTAGTTVTWVFGNGMHNVVGDGFESEVLSEGTFSHTFEEPGSYDYTCTLHQGMDGQVVVARSAGSDDA